MFARRLVVSREVKGATVDHCGLPFWAGTLLFGKASVVKGWTVLIWFK